MNARISPTPAVLHSPVSAALCWIMEAVVLLLIVLTPWALGAVDPPFEAAIFAAVGVLLALWGLRMMVDRKVLLGPTPLLIALALWFALGVVQILPLPRPVLRLLSPETAQLYEQLLPAEAEVLGDGASIAPPSERGKTLSVYPAATRYFLIRLLAVLALFVVVKENIASEASLRRLTVAATVNGFALALFAIFQHFRGPPNVIYGYLTAPAEVFGPFVCRNHFPFYLNLCIGLALGWLHVLRHRHRLLDPQPNVPLAILQQPDVLWLSSGLAVMVASVFLSRSRGGIVALLAALACGALLRLVLGRRAARWEVPLLVGGVVLALIVWFGMDLVNDRLRSLWQGHALQETRAPLWSMLFPLVGRFPLFGTGLGTFEAIEALQRQSPDDVHVQYEHAHNEYLEAWIEGGLIGLILALSLAALVVVSACRAFIRFEAQESGGLAWGAAIALFSALIHSVGDFGMHIPAIAVLVTVLMAQVVVLGSGQPRGPLPHAPLQKSPWRGLVLGGFVIFLGILLGLEGWRTWRVHQYRTVGYAWLATDRPDRFTRAAPFFAAAARLHHDKARLHLEASQAYLNAAEEQTSLVDMQAQISVSLSGILLSPVHPLSRTPAEVLIRPTAGMPLAEAAWEPILEAQEQQVQRSFTNLGLQHLLRARDLAPTLGAPHVRLAALRSLLAQAEPANRYIERAMQLVPVDPELWYVGGLVALADGDTQRALQYWKRSLDLSDAFMADILARCVVLLGPEATEKQIVPDDPNRLWKAAPLLYPEPSQEAQRRQILQRALDAFLHRGQQLSPEELQTLAEIYRALDHKAEARQALREALEQRPRQIRWRLVYAQWLVEDGMLDEALDEVRRILDQHPNHREARQLREAISDLRVRRGP